MRRHTRFFSVAIFAGLATVVGASLTWACTPSTFGTPATPAAPPTPAAVQPGPPVATPGTGVPAPAPVTVNVNRVPVASTGTSGAGSTSGAPIRTGAKGGNRTVGVNRTPSQNGSRAFQRSGVRTDFAQRATGQTVGTTTSRGGPVFSSAGVATKGKHASRGTQHAVASTPSTRTAAGDLWSGFKPSARSSVFAAEASAAHQPNGVSGTAVAALALLGLGLAGIAGAMAFVVIRTRRAKSRSTSGGNGNTQM